jgi:hypothetical protein
MPTKLLSPGTRQVGKSRGNRTNPLAAHFSSRRGSKRDEFLKLIQESEGLTRGEILEKMGLKGNKSGEMSVSNTLTALPKSNQGHSPRSSKVGGNHKKFAARRHPEGASKCRGHEAWIESLF